MEAKLKKGAHCAASWTSESVTSMTFSISHLSDDSDFCVAVREKVTRGHALVRC